jgi:hypothetical protein
METPLPLDLGELIGDAKAALRQQGIQLEAVDEPLLGFMLDRLRGMLKDSGHAVDVIEAVLAQRPTRIDLVPARLAAVREFLALPESLALAAANKRIGNILRKAESVLPEPDVALLEEDAEKALFQRVLLIAPLVRSHVANEDYADALKVLASVRAEVDRFLRRGDGQRPGAAAAGQPPGPPESAFRPAQRGRRHLQAGRMKLVILDRDGVINYDSKQFIKSPAEWRPDPGQPRGHRQAQPGRLPGGGRDQPVGAWSRPVRHGYAECHPRQDAPRGAGAGGRIDAIFYCPHAVDAGCHCRKPKPACSSALPTASTSICRARRPSAIPCATCRPPRGRRHAAAGADRQGDADQAEGGLPEGTLVFPDLAAAADHILSL